MEEPLDAGPDGMRVGWGWRSARHDDVSPHRVRNAAFQTPQTNGTTFTCQPREHETFTQGLETLCRKGPCRQGIYDMDHSGGCAYMGHSPEREADHAQGRKEQVQPHQRTLKLGSAAGLRLGVHVEWVEIGHEGEEAVSHQPSSNHVDAVSPSGGHHMPRFW